MVAKRKRYGEEEIIGKLREAEVGLAQGQSVGQVARKLGVSEQTYYRCEAGAKLSSNVTRGGWSARTSSHLRTTG